MSGTGNSKMTGQSESSGLRGSSEEESQLSKTTVVILRQVWAPANLTGLRAGRERKGFPQKEMACI